MEFISFLLLFSFMQHPNRRLVLVAIFGSILCAGLLPALASDHFLIIGGGDSPANNQVSLEKNVIFFQRLLADAVGGQAPVDVLFSDGNGATRDLEFFPEEDPPRLNELLAKLSGNDDHFYSSYRPHKLPGVRGPATRAGLDEWFNTVGKRLADNDRLFIYFTGHGGSGGPRGDVHDTTLSMWCERPMHVTEFVGLLDRLSPKVRVVLVMVQCHSGGFADVIFNGGKFGGELSEARRVGFFATTFDRNAAGCTPDTAEDDYKDYTTYFLAALDGKTRTGKPVSGCDIDGDGHVNLAEAHAYVMVHSETIDIPNTTSDALLRQYSKTSGDGLVRASMPFGQLLKMAAPNQKVVLNGLSDQLKLASEDRFNEAKHLAELVEAERKTVHQSVNAKHDEEHKLAEHIRKRLIRQWPELQNPWQARVPELMKADGPAMQKAIESDSDYARWDLLQKDADKLDDRELDLERKWAKCQRLVRTLETVALAANLPKVATPELVERYKQMLEDEAGVLGKAGK